MKKNINAYTRPLHILSRFLQGFTDKCCHSPHSCFIGLALLAGVHSVVAQVTNLGIAAAGQQSIIYWPTTRTTNYVLQTLTNLASANWVTASDTVTVNAVVVTNAAPSGYFRLSESAPPEGMALIPGGSFLMGNFIVSNLYNSATNDPDITDATPTAITVSAFYMDVNLVSLSQWTNVYGYATSHGYTLGAGSGKRTNSPVEMLRWYDCVAWCNARSAQAGLTPVYYSDAGFTLVYVNAFETNVYMNMMNSGYRLPTEAEWEKAARGGLTGNRFPWGNFITESQANYVGYASAYTYDLGPNGYNAIGSIDIGGPVGTSPVGSFAPNGYGLYDMAGNVYDWCWDWYGTPYGQPTTTNPTGPASGSNRVLRGGDWESYAFVARCAFRVNLSPLTTSSSFGFRCVRGL
jgi:formylglycine-generating enzyme required for sulfatase activity